MTRGASPPPKWKAPVKTGAFYIEIGESNSGMGAELCSATEKPSGGLFRHFSKGAKRKTSYRRSDASLKILMTQKDAKALQTQHFYDRIKQKYFKRRNNGG